MKVGWLIRIDGVMNVSTVASAFTFDGDTYTSGAISVEPPNETPERQEGWNVTLAAVTPAVQNVILAEGAPVAVEIELIYDDGSGWQSAGIAAKGVLSGPIWQPEGTWKVTVDTSLGDADLGTPLVWSDRVQQERYPGDTGMSKMGAESESILLRWPPSG